MRDIVELIEWFPKPSKRDDDEYARRQLPATLESYEYLVKHGSSRMAIVYANIQTDTLLINSQICTAVSTDGGVYTQWSCTVTPTSQSRLGFCSAPRIATWPTATSLSSLSRRAGHPTLTGCGFNTAAPLMRRRICRDVSELSMSLNRFLPSFAVCKTELSKTTWT